MGAFKSAGPAGRYCASVTWPVGVAQCPPRAVDCHDRSPPARPSPADRASAAGLGERRPSERGASRSSLHLVEERSREFFMEAMAGTVAAGGPPAPQVRYALCAGRRAASPVRVQLGRRPSSLSLRCRAEISPPLSAAPTGNVPRIFFCAGFSPVMSDGERACVCGCLLQESMRLPNSRRRPRARTWWRCPAAYSATT